MNYHKLKVVCFGGGTGLPALLSGLKSNPWLDITALVNMTDNGGSSGELIDRFGILPPGDILKCLLALSEDETFARKLLLHRIKNSIIKNDHTAGNILLLGLEQVYGDIIAAVDALGQALAVKGKVLPITLGKSKLCATYTDDSRAIGEVQVDDGVRDGKIVKELYLEPSAILLPEARAAIENADVLCIGPGSFYTSVLSTLLPDGIKDAFANFKGTIIYTSNLFSEGKGMNGLSLEYFVEFIERYIGRRIEYVIANKHLPEDIAVHDRYAAEDKYPLGISEAYESDPRFIFANLWLDHEIARHDSARLANLITALISKER
jgi:uncharacterized cofD-like protein